jgi:phosphoribosylanthranilate isomerase
MTLVKICGISRVEDAQAAAEAGADFVGLMFAESRRQIDEAKATEIVAALSKARSKPRTVGVFVNEDIAEINRLAAACGLDMVQLSGDEPWEAYLQIDLPVLKVVHVARGATSMDVLVGLKSGHVPIAQDMVRLVLDTASETAYGGTGETFDWSVAAEIAAEVPLVLAGGLTPENVAEAVATVKPWAVDVSTGVETDGVKDASRIAAFVKEVRRADGN